MRERSCWQQVSGEGLGSRTIERLDIYALGTWTCIVGAEVGKAGKYVRIHLTAFSIHH